MVLVVDNIDVGLRGSASIMPITSLYSVGPTLFMPDWHWGAMIGPANMGFVGGKREWGGQGELTIDYPLWAFFKLWGAAGVGICKDETEYTIRAGVGF
jgi:hypothetical protein